MTKSRLSSRICRWLLVCTLAPAAYAVQTDLATVPLITSAPQTVLPNLLYILDDSGSMGFSHMPDDTDRFGQNGSGTAMYGYRSAQCNGVYYNPSITYSPPVDSIGTPYANSSFTGAWINGFKTSTGTVNLSTSFQAYSSSSPNDTTAGAGHGLGGTADTSQAAYYYTYSGTQTSQAQKDYTSGTFFNECSSTVGSTPGSSVFTKVTVSATSGPGGTDERQNFANWYSYYRTRMLMMKSSTGLAFKTIGDKYRVGYMSINNNAGSSFINPIPFDADAKLSWYTKLYGATPSNSTPLRGALSTAGRIFANKVSSLYGVTVADPVQYSCQKNFTLLSTDGYWNETATPKQVDGSTDIGNQDSSEPRPFNDGSSTANIYTASITVSGSSNTSVSTITVGGVQILSTATSTSNKSRTVAQRIAANVTLAGYSAVVSGSTVTITAPASAGAISGTPVVVSTAGGMTFTAGAFTGTPVTTAGTSDTLADVAEYYYKTDLRTSALGNQLGRLVTSDGTVTTPDVSTNNVQPGGEDIAAWQHMTTFTLGLGARGRMIYSPSYKTDTTGDYYAVLNGLTASSTVCTWQTAGTVCNWPTPSNNSPENIDDLWHAAVNGRGTYFSATDSATLSSGLNTALQEINALTSDAAAATTSNPNVTAGDNFIFSSSFRSVDWYGDFERRQISVADVTTGTGANAVTVPAGTPAATADWQARPLLDANTSRTIYTRDATNTTTGLRPFLWANLTATEQAYFSTPYISSTASPPLSQFCASGSTCLISATQTAASGSALLSFIRGDRTNEGDVSDLTKYFRKRASVLGDIVNAEAVYVKTPTFSYGDAGYSAYKSTNASRQGMVYVGANDGMLHAFNSDTGVEAWAYVPQTLFPSLYKLADKSYSTQHQYYVDGSPTQADVYFGAAWHTILVGGFNDGGRGFYALDVTDPANPKSLWEVSDASTGYANMGYSYGRPEITKLADGTWVALLTSGYNNVQTGADGQGYLYVVNAGTGALIRSIGTGQGSSAAAVTGVCSTAPCPSGLAQIRAWVDNTTYDNTAQRVYGGDLFGNVWRFDINNNVGASGYDAQLLATLRGASGNVQSVTARPELGLVAGFSVVYVGTGRYLGATDLSDTASQSIYAIKDSQGSTGVGNPRATGTTFVKQTLTDAKCSSAQATAGYCTLNNDIRTGSGLPVNFATGNGWFVDLPATGERATTDPQLALGTLAFTTNVLDASACSVGGKSFINFFDYKTGAPVSTASGMVSVFLGNALATRPVLLRFSDGSVKSLVRMSDGTWQTLPTPTPPSPTGTRRTSWRELVNEQ